MWCVPAWPVGWSARAAGRCSGTSAAACSSGRRTWSNKQRCSLCELLGYKVKRQPNSRRRVQTGDAFAHRVNQALRPQPARGRRCRLTTAGPRSNCPAASSRGRTTKPNSFREKPTAIGSSKSRNSLGITCSAGSQSHKSPTASSEVNLFGVYEPVGLGASKRSLAPARTVFVGFAAP